MREHNCGRLGRRGGGCAVEGGPRDAMTRSSHDFSKATAAAQVDTTLPRAGGANRPPTAPTLKQRRPPPNRKCISAVCTNMAARKLPASSAIRCSQGRCRSQRTHRRRPVACSATVRRGCFERRLWNAPRGGMAPRSSRRSPGAPPPRASRTAPAWRCRCRRCNPKWNPRRCPTGGRSPALPWTTAGTPASAPPMALKATSRRPWHKVRRRTRNRHLRPRSHRLCAVSHCACAFGTELPQAPLPRERCPASGQRSNLRHSQPSCACNLGSRLRHARGR
mmetsp:Transcript_9352/g.26925  ORF Transcript_9352/g.26925 Transcript_9352/m.26925 type:complete len:278 (-) Transcript_9352:850-1683(-)